MPSVNKTSNYGNTFRHFYHPFRSIPELHSHYDSPNADSSLPVTEEVAGSSPLAPLSSFKKNAVLLLRIRGKVRGYSASLPNNRCNTRTAWA